MAVVGRIVMDLIARTGQFTQGIRNAQGQLQGFANRSKGIMGGLAGSLKAAAPFAATGLVTKAIQDMESFNQAMAKSTAIMGGLSQETKKQMADVARTVSKETLFSATEAAQAYYYLASAGMDATQSMQALPQVAQFAQAGAFDLSQATDLLTDAQSALGLSSKDAATNLKNLTHVSDVLVKANTLANASVEQFSTALTNKAAAAARSVGMDMEELVAVLAVFADQGIKAEEAGTAATIVLRDLQTQAIGNAAAFEAMGIHVFDSAGEFNHIADIVSQMESALSGLSDEQKRVALGQLGFTDKSIAFSQALLGTSEKMRDYLRELKRVSGTTKNVAGDMVTPLQKSMNRLNALWEEFTNKNAPPVIDSLVKIGNAIAFVTEKADAAQKALDKAFGSNDLFQNAFKNLNVPGLSNPVNALGDAIEGIEGGFNKLFGDKEAAKQLKALPAPGVTSKPKLPTKAIVKSVAEELGIANVASPIGGVGAVETGSVEGFNNLQRAVQRQNSQQLAEDKKQTVLLEKAEKTLSDIRRAVERPTTEIEFA